MGGAADCGATRKLKQKLKEVQGLTSKIVELLLRSGAGISTPDVGPGGNTALHLAANLPAWYRFFLRARFP